MTTSEFAIKTGVRISTVKRWDRLGVLSPARGWAGILGWAGIKYYSDEDVAHALRLISTSGPQEDQEDQKDLGKRDLDALTFTIAHTPGSSLEGINELSGGRLAKVLASRRDAPLDRLGELTGYDLAWVLSRRPDAPLDRLWVLHGPDLAMVLVNRPDSVLDRMTELTEGDLASVLARRLDAPLGRIGELKDEHQTWVRSSRDESE